MVSGALCIFLVFLLNYAGYCHISGSKLDPEIFQTAVSSTAILSYALL